MNVDVVEERVAGREELAQLVGVERIDDDGDPLPVALPVDEVDDGWVADEEVSVADEDELEDPADEVEDDCGGQVEANGNCVTPLSTPASFGISVAPFSISTTLLPLASKFDCANAISLFCRS